MKFLYQRLMLRTSLVYFIIGIFIGLLMFLGYRVKSLEFIFYLREVHVHILLVGFVIQLIMGVALWFFPRKMPVNISEREKMYRAEEIKGIILYIIFNSGTVLRSLFEGFIDFNSLFYFFSLTGIILQTVSIFYFLILVVPRIRRPG